MPKVWIGLGANLGDRLGNIVSALGAVAWLPDTRLLAVSSVYDSAPLGRPDQPRFLNAVALLETDLDPHTLLRRLLAIERKQGRVRGERWGPRAIDLDILVYEGMELSTEDLTVPHPGAAERGFVLVPLAEISPDLRIPGTGKAPAELLEELGDEARDIRCVSGPPIAWEPG